MDRKQALYVAVFAAVVGFAIAFAYPAFNPTRVLWYYPLERRWAFELKPTGLAMDWYGRNLLAAIVSIVGFAGAYGVGRRLKPLAPSGYRLWAAWAASAVLIATSLYAYQLVGRNPVPAPLPSSYVPK